MKRTASPLAAADLQLWSRTRRRGLAPALLATLLLAGLAPAPAAAQDEARPEREERFEGRADVVEVQIPVNVADRQGNPVRGLTAADFTVIDRGKRREVTDLRVVDLALISPADAAGGARAMEVIPAAARRHFLLLFDLSFSTPASVVKAREAAHRFVLGNLHATDLAAVVIYSLDRGPRLLVTFTPDRAQLARAIDTLGAPRLLDQRAEIDPLRFMIDDPETAARTSSTFAQQGGVAGNFAGIAAAEVQAYLSIIAEQFDRQRKSYNRGRITSWMTGLEEMANVLRSVEGRKHVVLFSEGFDGRLLFGRGPDGLDPEAQEDQFFLETGQSFRVDSDDIYGNTGLQRTALDMLEKFKRADCVIQAIDISGLGSEDADDRRARQVGQDALYYLANETGGRLYEDANDLGRQLDGLLESTSVTYILTIQPDDLAADGSFHPLTVRADLPRGAQLSHRAGYFAPRPFEDLHPLEKALMAADGIAAGASQTRIPLNVLAASFRANPERAYVPVIIEVDGAALLAGHEGNQLKTEFYAYVSNAQGEMKDFFTQMVNLELSGNGRATMEQSGLKYYGHLDLAPGDYLIRVLVRNAATGATGVESVPLTVPIFEAAAPELLPPFFPEPQGRWFLVREQTTNEQGSVVYPFTVNGSPYVPAAEPVVSPGEASDLVLVAYNLDPSAVELDGVVTAADGRELPASELFLVERTVTGIGGLDKLLARFRIDDLPSGSYTLKIALSQPGAGVMQSNSIPFRVAR